MLRCLLSFGAIARNLVRPGSRFYRFLTSFHSVRNDRSGLFEHPLRDGRGRGAPLFSSRDYFGVPRGHRDHHEDDSCVCHYTAIKRGNAMKEGRYYIGLLLAIVTTLSLPLLVQAQELLVERQISLSLAQEAAQGAIEQCRADGFRVSVAVVDRAGNLKVLLRDDETGPHTVDSSRRKAFTASLFRTSTTELANRVARDATLANLEDITDGLLFLGGGLPIRVGDEVVGGIGVGGAPQAAADEICAQAGISRIAGGQR